MKFPFIVIFLLVVICFFTACSKKDSTVTNIIPNTQHAITSATVTQLSTATYPYTDTFAGSMVVAFRDFGADYDSTSNNYKFYVTHLSESLLLVKGSDPIELERYSGIININDSVVFRANITVDSGDMHLFPYEQNSGEVIKNGIAFQFTGNKLLINWEISGVPLIGACDEGESIGNFTGSLVHKNR